jgi:hypothetical protein
MDPVRDPYRPGAGLPPPELAGRQTVMDSAQLAIEKAKIQKILTNQVLLGLRGVGKTVLLVEFERLAEKLECYPTRLIEVDSNKSLVALLLPQLLRLMIRLDRIKKAEHGIAHGLRMLRAVASVFNVKIGSVEISVSEGEATGDLASDLTDILIELGEIASARSTNAVIIIDEIQCLSNNDFSSLIIALHKVSQRKLPITFLGAGLPQLPKLAGDAKSYAERLFNYTRIDKLERRDAIQAIVEPAASEDVYYDDEALDLILHEGYPYYLQLRGSEA